MNIDLEVIINYCDEGNIKDLKKYLKNKKPNAKLINNMFINSCTNGKIQIVKWILENYSNNYTLKYEMAFKKAASNTHNNVANFLLKFMYETDCDFDDIFSYCCNNNLLIPARCIYKLGIVCVNDIFNKTTNKIKKYGLIKNNEVLKYLIGLSKQELKNDKFLALCVLGNLADIQQYYLENNIFIEYKMHNAYNNLCNTNNNDCIKWILSIYTPSDFVLIQSLITMCKNNNSDMILHINNMIQNKKIINEEMVNDICDFLINEGEFEVLKKIHELNYTITNLGVIFSCILTIGGSENINDTEYFQWFYLKYVDTFEQHIQCKIMTFIHCCELINTSNIAWLHKRLKLFNSTDKLYLKCMYASCRSFNIYVAEWLANLYGEYEIAILDCSNGIDMDDIYITFSKFSKEKIIYKKISQEKLTNYQKCEQLKITKFMNKNDKISDCSICLDNPSDLIQLNCNHFTCITCLCTWFLNKDQVCTYCKSPVIWSECKKMHYDMDNVIENIDGTITSITEETDTITKNYNDIINNCKK